MSHPPDVREDILARLLEIFAEIVPPANAFRNRLRIPEEMLPALTVLDGDETPDDSAYGRGRPSSTPVLVTMEPEMYGFVKGDDSGTQMNTMRKTLIGRILKDETLLGLCADDGIRYQGFSTGMALGRSLEGEFAISFAFVYVLRPKSL